MLSIGWWPGIPSRIGYSILTVRTPLPSPPPQGGREQENQGFKLPIQPMRPGGAERLPSHTHDLADSLLEGAEMSPRLGVEEIFDRPP